MSQAQRVQTLGFTIYEPAILPRISDLSILTRPISQGKVVEIDYHEPLPGSGSPPIIYLTLNEMKEPANIPASQCWVPSVGAAYPCQSWTATGGRQAFTVQVPNKAHVVVTQLGGTLSR